MESGFDLTFKRDCQKRLVYQFEADRPLPRTLHRFMRPFGEVRYYPGFPRPLIKMDVPGRFHASGIEGDYSFKVTLRDETDHALPRLVHKALMLSFACDGCGVCRDRCSENAISLDAGFLVDTTRCTACLECLDVCPVPLPPLDQELPPS
jgi:ferredoxin